MRDEVRLGRLDPEKLKAFQQEKELDQRGPAERGFSGKAGFWMVPRIQKTGSSSVHICDTVGSPPSGTTFQIWRAVSRPRLEGVYTSSSI